MDGEQTVGAFHTAHDAELAKAYLKKRGIEARLDEANVVVGMNPLWDPALGGVRVLVPDDAAARAKKLLAKFQRRLAKERDPELYTETHEPDAAAARAFRAAVLGFFCAPVFLHLYSLWVLSKIDGPLSPTGKRNRTAALIVDWGTVIAAIVLVPMMCSG